MTMNKARMILDIAVLIGIIIAIYILKAGDGTSINPSDSIMSLLGLN